MTIDVAIALAALGVILFLVILVRLALDFRALRDETADIRQFLNSEHTYKEPLDQLYVQAQLVRQACERASHAHWHTCLEIEEALDKALDDVIRGLIQHDPIPLQALTTQLQVVLASWQDNPDTLRASLDAVRNAIQAH